jgi:formylglycine-generating enzyme required for sulfatase activity
LKVTSNQKILADTRVGNFTLDQIGIKMVSIPGGTFKMGSTNGYSNEKPVHSVTLSEFEMSATEITQGQYKAVMGMNPSRFTGDDYLPVERVNWGNAVAFCRELSQKTGSEFRLPTEAEWEYACRAGTTTKYHTGNSKSDLARADWYGGNSGKKTHPVGQKTPNAWGLYDMHGNVWEWCADWYGNYSSGSATNPMGPSSGSDRVARGGSWISDASICRSAFRSGHYPLVQEFRVSVSAYVSHEEDSLGFRVVRRPQ